LNDISLKILLGVLQHKESLTKQLQKQPVVKKEKKKHGDEEVFISILGAVFCSEWGQ